MLEAKALNTSYDLVEDKDETFNSLSIPESRNFSSVSTDFFRCNKYITIVSGYLIMNAVSLASGDELFRLPNGQTVGNLSTIICVNNKGVFTCSIKKANANVFYTNSAVSFIKGEYCFVMGIINRGGGG